MVDDREYEHRLHRELCTRCPRTAAKMCPFCIGARLLAEGLAAREGAEIDEARSVEMILTRSISILQ